MEQVLTHISTTTCWEPQPFFAMENFCKIVVQDPAPVRRAPISDQSQARGQGTVQLKVKLAHRLTEGDKQLAAGDGSPAEQAALRKEASAFPT